MLEVHSEAEIDYRNLDQVTKMKKDFREIFGESPSQEALKKVMPKIFELFAVHVENVQNHFNFALKISLWASNIPEMEPFSGSFMTSFQDLKKALETAGFFIKEDLDFILEFSGYFDSLEEVVKRYTNRDFSIISADQMNVLDGFLTFRER